MEDRLSLTEAFERQQRDKERELRRRTRAFANRMWAVCFSGVGALLLLALAAQTWGRSRQLVWMGNVMAGLLALAWLYALLLLGLFWWRTRLSAHVLHSYWIWLSMLVGAPVDFARLMYGSLRIPIWLVLVLVGSLLWRWRINRADAELRARSSDWERLFELSWNDLIVMRFTRLSKSSST